MIMNEHTDRGDQTPLIINSPGLGLGAQLQDEKGHAIGTKSLNTFYSIVFIINQIYGPGVLAIPAVFQQAGWLYTTIVLFLFAVISCFSATLLCEALSLIPGNKQFDKHIEFTGAVRHYFGNKWYMVFQLLMNVCMQSYNIASIVICAQSLDSFIMYVGGGKTYALEIFPHPQFLVVHHIEFLYDCSAICISLGYIVITLFCLPAGFLNLEDNIKVVQLGSFVALILLMGEFCVQFLTIPLEWKQVPPIAGNFSQLVSIFIFSWAYVMFIPSWVNEKRNDVSINKVIWFCGGASFIGYLLIGMLAALTVSGSQSDDILKSLTLNYPTITVIAAYIFSLGVIAPGIPVCCITTRYNLYIGKVCGKRWSYFWGVVAPWLIAFVFSQSKYFAAFINWTSLIVNGVVNFLVPLLLYFKAISITPPTAEETSSVLGGNDSSSSSSEIITTYKSAYDVAPSTVEPWPKFMRKNAKFWTGKVFIVTTILVVAQIIYVIVKRDSMGSSSASPSTCNASQAVTNV